MKGLSSAVLALAVSATFTMPMTGAGQQDAAPATGSGGGETWTLPRTPDGQPDLQGYWTNATYTPMERPPDITKEFYTE